MDRHKQAKSGLRGTIARLFDSESAAGILLIVVALAAMVVANSPLVDAYHELFHHPLGWSPVAKLDSLHLWINDGLMAVFFFVVGLEIKREVLDGELSSPAKRRLPVLAAAAGMAVPAAIYLAIAGTGELARGWAIPAATDIAFAVGVLGLLGPRVPRSLRLFLLTVAIVDDLGAVTIIAVFYTEHLAFGWLAAAAAGLGAMIALGRFRIDRALPYAVLAVLVWYAVLHSGIHATIAGVAAAMAIPLRLNRHGESLLLRMEHALVRWNGFLVVPLFGFANAGVSLAGLGWAGLVAPLPLAIASGLVLGKQVGIFGAIALAERLGFASRPAGAGWLQLWGIALLCGIGFTMSLFIGALAFPAHPALVEEAKLGVLLGSLIAAVLGFTVLRFARGDRAASPA
ncbi:MAG TPA: Na+/H+ antiporter NhaA [Novosphingobium sp.]|nr:Na+/H+ antiporter NhaA [Novosphingobium sp.]